MMTDEEKAEQELQDSRLENIDDKLWRKYPIYSENRVIHHHPRGIGWLYEEEVFGLLRVQAQTITG